MTFTLNVGMSADELDAATQSLGVELPNDYRAFLQSSNGGQGFLGQNYVIFWKAEELKPLNVGYEVPLGLVLFGTDGGGEAYAFDSRERPWKVVQVPLIGMDDPRLAIPLGSSFTEFCRTLPADGARWDGRPHFSPEGMIGTVLIALTGEPCQRAAVALIKLRTVNRFWRSRPYR